MAILLSAVKVLNNLKGSFTGNIIFIFEVGEETCCGINEMIEKLKYKEIDAIYGTHLTSFMDTGTICIDEGPRMDGAACVGIYVHDKVRHISRPDLSINPIFWAVQMLN